MNLGQATTTQLVALQQELNTSLKRQTANRPTLDLTRGKPSVEQLELSNALEHQIQGNYFSQDGIDTRNYGGLRGLPEARQLGAELLGVDAAQVIAFGNSSLFLMHLCCSIAQRQGLWGDERRWSTSNPIKVLTPVPGYDRHFALCENLGFEMVNVPMLADGPDMAEVNRLAAADDSIKAIWCVPKFSNPTGATYSSATVTAMGELPNVAAADDFLVIWDNAYAVHGLRTPTTPLASLWDAALAAQTTDNVVQFASTSKITFAGAGVSFIAASDKLLGAIEEQMSLFTIGPDKVSQLSHARFLAGRVAEHMANHAKILSPKFDLVEEALVTGLDGWDIATWTKPNGGYFVSVDTKPGLASAVVAKAKAAGLSLTAAGATFPYQNDPDDSNVRLAPTFATLDELQVAMQVFLLCLKLAAIEKRLA